MVLQISETLEGGDKTDHVKRNLPSMAYESLESFISRIYEWGNFKDWKIIWLWLALQFPNIVINVLFKPALWERNEFRFVVLASFHGVNTLSL